MKGAEMAKKKLGKEVNLSQYNGVWIIGEQICGNISSVTFELITEGRKLANKIREELSIVILGFENDRIFLNLQHYGVDKIFYIKHKFLKSFNAEIYIKCISNLALKEKPEIILIGSTLIGKIIGPKIAEKINVKLISNCIKLDINDENNELPLRNLNFGKNLVATIVCRDCKPQISTIFPGAFRKTQYSEKLTGVMEIIEPELKSTNIHVH